MKQTRNYLVLLAFFLCISHSLSAQEQASDCENHKSFEDAENGTATAQFDLGICWHSKQNFPEAAMWFRKAAEQGTVGAQTNLGVMHLEGKGVPKNYSEAAIWFRKAADQGNGSAQRNLGILYYAGEGVPQDYEECYIWASLASVNDSNLKTDVRDACASMISPKRRKNAQKEVDARLNKLN